MTDFHPISTAAPRPPEPDYAAERDLPAGLTCADCRHGDRCDALFGAVRRNFTKCDFWPSRFAYAVCPVCSGDCGSANPPVINCPMRAGK